jgi:hypothetical protein
MPKGIKVDGEILGIMFGYGLKEPLDWPREPGCTDNPPPAVLHGCHPDAKADEEQVNR